MEGSAMAGPYLPIPMPMRTLSNVHSRLGWGSVYNMGLPQVTFKHGDEDSTNAFGFFSLPEAWLPEIIPDTPEQVAESQEEHGALNASHTDIILERLLVQHQLSKMNRKATRAILGIPGNPGVPITPLGFRADCPFQSMSPVMKPGWTSHLPGQRGMICPVLGHHPEVYHSEVPSLVAEANKLCRSQFEQNCITRIECGSPAIFSFNEIDKALIWTPTPPAMMEIRRNNGGIPGLNPSPPQPQATNDNSGEQASNSGQSSKTDRPLGQDDPRLQSNSDSEDSPEKTKSICRNVECRQRALILSTVRKEGNKLKKQRMVLRGTSVRSRSPASNAPQGEIGVLGNKAGS